MTKKLRPSSFERIVLCPGSYNLEKKITKENDNIHAERGRRLHDVIKTVMECALKAYISCERVPNRNVSHVFAKLLIENDSCLTDLDEEDRSDILQIVCNFNHIFDNDPEITYYSLEKTYDLGFINEGMCGTPDIVLMIKDPDSKKHQLHIIDYKFGKGERVTMFNNWQLLLYKVAVSKTFSNIEHETTLHIMQPAKYYHGIWKLTYLEDGYYENVNLYKDIINLAMGEGANLNPIIKACKYCSAKAICPAFFKINSKW